MQAEELGDVDVLMELFDAEDPYIGTLKEVEHWVEEKTRVLRQRHSLALCPCSLQNEHVHGWGGQCMDSDDIEDTRTSKPSFCKNFLKSNLSYPARVCNLLT